ncbi:MAG: RNA polymerase sigma factor [bacterium]|jgi:RNA polymerase sigma-70 factor (ECF subfamily)
MEARDEELLIVIANGDPAPLRTLYDRYKSRIMTYAFYVLGDRAAAEDVVQETFLRVFKHARRFDPEKRFSTWIYSIAANLCRDELRKRARRRDFTLPLLYEPAEDRVSSPLRAAAGREFATRLREELGRLSAEQREVIVLRFIDSMAYADIAEIAGCPLGTVQSRLHAALKVLRERLKEFRA